MTQVIHYRDHRKALARWYPTERLNFLKAEGLVPETVDYVDTAPSEYCPPDSDQE